MNLSPSARRQTSAGRSIVASYDSYPAAIAGLDSAAGLGYDDGALEIRASGLRISDDVGALGTRRTPRHLLGGLAFGALLGGIAVILSWLLPVEGAHALTIAAAAVGALASPVVRTYVARRTTVAGRLEADHYEVIAVPDEDTSAVATLRTVSREHSPSALPPAS
jgi:hypothetical protein